MSDTKYLTDALLTALSYVDKPPRTYEKSRVGRVIRNALRRAGVHDNDVASAMRRAVILAGGPAALSRALQLTPQAVSAWSRCPAAHVKTVSELSGIPPHMLRPDIFNHG